MWRKEGVERKNDDDSHDDRGDDVLILPKRETQGEQDFLFFYGCR
jgi:hypothetical protein